ncbi:MAG: transglutaminase-like domain-containing protein [Luteolibacter sp.]
MLLLLAVIGGVGLSAVCGLAAQDTLAPVAIDPVAFPWQKAGSPPEELRAAFVAPDTFLDEDHPEWRAEMLRRFAPVVKDCKTRREAILAVATEAAKTCGTRYTTERHAPNQSVQESLQSGKASCTGLSILLAAAYRSVGIPARLAGVGEWGDRPGNHTWVEVWDDDGWHFVEYYPDKKGLDAGWILDPIIHLDPKNPRSRVMAVDAAGPLAFFLPWDPDNGSIRAVDRTADYLKIASAQGLVKSQAVTDCSAATAIFECLDKAGARVAVAFKVMDGEREMFSGNTPGPLDDLNHVPRAGLGADHAYTVTYQRPDGVSKSLAVALKAGPPVKVLLPLE